MPKVKLFVVGMLAITILTGVSLNQAQAQSARCYQILAANKVQYQKIGSISQGSCGARSPLRFSSLKIERRVTISPPATTRCSVAAALARWFKVAVQPAAFRAFGSFVVKVHNISSYSCRSRPSGRLSEHAKANALDIKGFTLANGMFISVLNDWHSGGVKSSFLRSIHRKACGPFKTVLGPNANAAHRDHFHLDMAVYRSGTYCR